MTFEELCEQAAMKITGYVGVTHSYTRYSDAGPNRTETGYRIYIHLLDKQFSGSAPEKVLAEAVAAYADFMLPKGPVVVPGKQAGATA